MKTLIQHFSDYKINKSPEKVKKVEKIEKQIIEEPTVNKVTDPLIEFEPLSRQSEEINLLKRANLSYNKLIAELRLETKALNEKIRYYQERIDNYRKQDKGYIKFKIRKSYLYIFLTILFYVASVYIAIKLDKLF